MLGPEDNPQLISLIQQEIKYKGRIPFARFMELALYHPEHGYYAARSDIFGRSGDYYTSVDVHPVFGRLLAHQLEQMWRLLDCPAPFTLVEMGAGRGFLCLDVLTSLHEMYPDCFSRVRYLVDERGPAQRRHQQELLSGNPLCKRVEWQSIDGMAPGGMDGVCFSNELVDAFPVHQVVMTGAGPRENYVVLRNGEFTFEPGPVSDERIVTYLESYGAALAPGWTAEINLQAAPWMTRLAGLPRRGFVITIDYGDTAARLYHVSRSRGTLMCYSRHTVSEDPLTLVGARDITAHVNFTDLMRAGDAAGLHTAGLVKQMFFLLGLLEADTAAAPPSMEPPSMELLKRNLAIKNLIAPGGLGAFLVLLQYKGFDTRPDLIGLRAAP
jgi:SAM-dependent MidA family methyltransferase